MSSLKLIDCCRNFTAVRDGLCLACGVFCYFMLPLLLVPWSRAWLYVLLPYVLITPFHWSIAHEAVQNLMNFMTEYGLMKSGEAIRIDALFTDRFVR